MRLSSLLFAATLLLFYSCQKEIDGDVEPSTPQNPPAVSGNLKAKIEGAQWVADKVAAASKFGGYINITGISKDKKILVITLTDSGVHKYKVSTSTINAAGLVDSSVSPPITYTSNQGVFPTQSGGEVNITAIDTLRRTMSGTFSFKVFNEAAISGKTVSEGSFTNLSYAGSMPPISATDTFRVKIDGSSWAPASITAHTGLGMLSINGTSSDASKTVGLLLPAAIKPGNYTFETFGTYMGQYNPDADPLRSKAAVSGTLTVLEHNTTTKRIRGNFSFRGEELLKPQNFANISEGYFSVIYQ